MTVMLVSKSFPAWNAGSFETAETPIIANSASLQDGNGFLLAALEDQTKRIVLQQSTQSQTKECFLKSRSQAITGDRVTPAELATTNSCSGKTSIPIGLVKHV